ncbi:Hypothetical protein Minf_1309 [Methylacidiphilum infernorum V4]|uniref:Uncharacterized protein n=1 Tax=Methylacidiphilum infernorum (isolate V4) TaxID=481448 RepID=B3DVL0_METI4|nr:Hypothetical protein Minf_1309 [Methylacidiphilum infernorum V4]
MREYQKIQKRIKILQGFFLMENKKRQKLTGH